MHEYDSLVTYAIDEVAKKLAVFDQSKDATATCVVLKCSVRKKPKGVGIPSPESLDLGQ